LGFSFKEGRRKKNLNGKKREGEQGKGVCRLRNLEARELYSSGNNGFRGGEKIQLRGGLENLRGGSSVLGKKGTKDTDH